MKTCKKCSVEKPLEDFYDRPGSTDGKRSNCKVCHNTPIYERVAANPIKHKSSLREYHLKRTYGITIQQYNQLLENQKGGCAMCGKTPEEEKRNLAVDHNHKTGEIRGLLCGFCNHRVVGRHRDGALLRKMADYVDGGTGWFVPPKKPKRRKKK